MSVVVIGLNHRTAPIGLLERFAVPADRLAKALADLALCPNLSEAVVLSTCNRTEVYAVAERFHGAYGDIRDVLCDLGGVGPEALTDHLYTEHDEGAVKHLFCVAAGLESSVLGETEILGQVRTAWERAHAEGASRSVLNLLFRHAVEVGKRVRTDTGISRSTSSVSHAAVEMARDSLGSLADKQVLVVGAGEMGEGVVVALAASGVGEVLVANRTSERAVALAARVGGSAVLLGSVADVLSTADLLLTSTGAGLVVTTETVPDRSNRPLLIIDIALPRDVASDVGELPGVTLLDLDHLRRWAERGQAERQGEVAAVRGIIDVELVRYGDAALARQVAPLIAELHDTAEGIRRSEIERASRRFTDLTEREREAVEALTRSIVAKLLHPLTSRLRDDVGSPRGERNAAALRDLYDLQ